MIIDWKDILKVFILILCILVIDVVFITLNKKMWETDVEMIQKSPLKLRTEYALVVYILIVIGVCVFVLFSDTKTIYDKMVLGFIWGVITYGVFDFTNLTIFSNYNFKTAMIDTLWGGIMVAFSVGLTECIFNCILVL